MSLTDLNRTFKTLWCWSHVYLGWKAAQSRSRALPPEELEAFWKERHFHFANLIWSNITQLRGWWVKVGQFLSTRSDLLPAEYIVHLAKLQDMMPTSPIDVVLQLIEDELGSEGRAEISYIEDSAMASASIGQVHRATLTNGDAVVVKVQHPDIENLLKQDIKNLTQLSWAFGLLERGMNFAPMLEEWQRAAAKELDFRYELQHQERAYQAAVRSGIRVIIPRCYPELTTKRVMVMEFVEGFKITNLKLLEENKVDRVELMTKLCDSFAYQIHIDGQFNGDPHPGNILVHIDKDTNEATPVILDWGLVKEFEPCGQVAFSKLVFAVASLNVMGLMEAFEEMGFQFKDGSVIDPEVYMDALRVAFRDSDMSEGDTNNLRSQGKAALDAGKKAGLKREDIEAKNPIEDWPKDIIFFIRVASLLHGLCVQLEAKVPFLQIMVKRAQECLYNRYSPPSPLVYMMLPPHNRSYLRSKFELRLFRVLADLLTRELILGCQVAVCYDGELLADLAVGRMGPIDTRPVTSDSLFCGYCVTKGLLSTALLKLLEENIVSLDEPVCHWWDGFVRYGKRSITVKQVLTHSAGLHRALPEDLTLSKLCDYSAMVSIIEDSKPLRTTRGQYAYLTSGWLLSEIVRAATGKRIDQYIADELIAPLGLQKDLHFPITYVESPQSRKQTDIVGTSDWPATDSTEERYGTKSLDASLSGSPQMRNLSPQRYSSRNYQHQLSSSPSFLECSPESSVKLPTTLPMSPRLNQSELPDSALLRSDSLPREGAHSAGSIIQRQKEQRGYRRSPVMSILQGDNSPAPMAQNTISAADSLLHLTTCPLETERKASFSTADYTNYPLGGSCASDCGHTPSRRTSDDTGPGTRSRRFFSCRSEDDLSLAANQLRISEPNVFRQSTLPEALSNNPSTSEGNKPNFEPSQLSEDTSKELQDKYFRAKFPPSVLNITSTTPLPWRLTSSRREVKLDSISNDEVMQKLNKAKNFAETQTGSAARVKAKRVSPLDLIKIKPHVLDPLIYDSKRLVRRLIPPTNGRYTAKGLAQFYSALAAGEILKPSTVDLAREVSLVDESLETLLVSGGGSRTWGLGYQLYKCKNNRPRREKRDPKPTITGLGHGDFGGSVALCFPELKLSIAILLNDVLTGPEAARTILQFILPKFGLTPDWKTSVSLDEILSNLSGSRYNRR